MFSYIWVYFHANAWLFHMFTFSANSFARRVTRPTSTQNNCNKSRTMELILHSFEISFSSDDRDKHTKGCPRVKWVSLLFDGISGGWVFLANVNLCSNSFFVISRMKKKSEPLTLNPYGADVHAIRDTCVSMVHTDTASLSQQTSAWKAQTHARISEDFMCKLGLIGHEWLFKRCIYTRIFAGLDQSRFFRKTSP